ncbi:MAG: ATP-dependent helicase HrpB [Myxococcaceae bacterium]
MAINPLGAASAATLSGAGSAQQGESFGKVLKGQVPSRPEGAPIPVKNGPATEAKSVQQAQAGKCRVEAGAPVTQSTPVSATRVLDQVNQAQARMEKILQLAESGKSFSPAELLSLQTHVYRASQELDLAGKVVEKATGGVKQVLQTQV